MRNINQMRLVLKLRASHTLPEAHTPSNDSLKAPQNALGHSGRTSYSRIPQNAVRGILGASSAIVEAG